MKNRIIVIMSVILLTHSVLLPFFPSDAEADTTITITFAAGGVACGAYLFFRFTLRESVIEQNQGNIFALFNLGPQGWQVKFPYIDLRQNEEPKMFRSERLSESVQVDLLHIRF